MAKTTVVRSCRSRANEPISWEALFRIFIALWGDDVIELPHYPKVLGGVHAWWREGDGTQHDAELLDEVRDAYQKELTYDIFLWGSINNGHSIEFRYWPAKVEVEFKVAASDQITAENLVDVVKNEFPLVNKYVFISYDTSEYMIATFMAEILEKRLAPGVSVFLAKRDISPGLNPLKVMLEEQLLRAEALVALCSRRSINSPWLWWESAAVWARGGLVIPLFIGISPNEFNGPITLVCQGRSFLEVDDLNSVISTIVSRVSPGGQINGLSDKEVEDLEKLKSIVTS